MAPSGGTSSGNAPLYPHADISPHAQPGSATNQNARVPTVLQASPNGQSTQSRGVGGSNSTN
jgi:hypothetical protein